MPNPKPRASTTPHVFKPPQALASRLDCRLTFLVYEFLVNFAEVVEPWRKTPISIDQFEEAFSLPAAEFALGAQISARHAREYVTYLINVYHPIRLSRSSANEEAEKRRWEERVYDSIAALVSEGYLEQNPYPTSQKQFFEINSGERMEILYALTCRALQSAAIRNYIHLHRNLVRCKPIGTDSNHTDYYILSGTDRIYSVTSNNEWSLLSLCQQDVEKFLDLLRKSDFYANESLARTLTYELECRAAEARAAVISKERPKDPVFRALRNLGIDLDVAVSFQNINRTRSQTTQSSTSAATHGNSRSQGSNANSGSATASSLTRRTSPSLKSNNDEPAASSSSSSISQTQAQNNIARRKRAKKSTESLLQQYKNSLGIKVNASTSSINSSVSSNGTSNNSSVDAFKKLFDGSRNQADSATKKASDSTRRKRSRSESPHVINRVTEDSTTSTEKTDGGDKTLQSRGTTPPEPVSVWSDSSEKQATTAQVEVSPAAKKIKMTHNTSAAESASTIKSPSGPFARMMAFIQRNVEK